jgi:MFS family permease
VSRAAHRDLHVLVGAYGLSALGDQLTLIALLLRTHDLSGSGPAVAGVTVASLLPLVVFAPVAGLLVDRVETVRVLTVAALFQAVVVTTLAFTTSLPATLALVVLLGLSAAVERSGLVALVPVVAGEARATRSYAAVVTAQTVGGSAGPALAGALVAGVGATSALLLDAASFVVLALLLDTLRARRRPAPVAVGERRWGQLRAGVTVVGADPLLRVVVAVLAGAVLAGTLINVASVFFAKDVLGVGDLGYGLLVSAWSLGMVAGSSLVAARIPDRWQALGLVVAAVAIGLAFTAMAGAPNLPVALGAVVVAGAGNGVQTVALRSLVRSRIPDRLRGRAFASASALVTAANLAGTSGGGVLVNAVGPQATIQLAGIGTLLAGLVGLAWFRRLVSPAVP